jgi:long-subunit fatty acid transport protein
MDVRNADYDVTLPMKASAGFSTEYRSYNFLMDMDWEQFSKMDSKFEDRTTIKAGFEKNKRNTTYRLGLMHMSGVYEGAYRLPIHQSTDPAVLYNWDVIPKGGVIGDTDQLYVTLGFTYHFKGGSFSMGAMRDVLGHVPATHLSSSLSFNLDTLKGKRFIIFDK